jgi:hypothetical protein
MPFVKGQSGNPGGRPKVLEEARRLAQSFTEENILGLMELAKDPDQPGQVRVSARNAVLDRALGKPVQPNEHSGPEGGPMLHQVEDLRKPIEEFAAEFASARSATE